MSAPINLNKVKKERDRSSRKARANENAVGFGQTKAQKDALKARANENAVGFGQTKAQKDALKARAEQIARNSEAHKRET